jgi:hypothetical protein
MKPTTLEWLNKAEEDWYVAQMSYRARRHPSYDAPFSMHNNAPKSASKPDWKKLALRLAEPMTCSFSSSWF